MVAHEIRDLIVHFVEDGFVTSAAEHGGDGFHGIEEAVFFPVGDGYGMNGVAVVIVEDEDVVVPGDGGADESPSLVGEGAASDREFADVDIVSA